MPYHAYSMFCHIYALMQFQHQAITIKIKQVCLSTMNSKRTSRRSRISSLYDTYPDLPCEKQSSQASTMESGSRKAMIPSIVMSLTITSLSLCLILWCQCWHLDLFVISTQCVRQGLEVKIVCNCLVTIHFIPDW